MAYYDTYRDQLAGLYHGHALWVPDPAGLYDRVRVGDVGYVRQGHFFRMFNALLPADDRTQAYGVPEGFVPLNMGRFTNIRTLNLYQGDYCSSTVAVDREDGRQAAGPNEGTSASFKCSRRNKGAFLSLPLKGVRMDAIRTKAFETYIRRHCDSWLEFASVNDFDVRLEDIIFVTGCDLTSSWAMATFANSLNPEITLHVRTSRAGSATFQWDVTNQPHHNEPDQNIVQSHCVFLRGFRVKRILPFYKTLKAAAGPRPDNPDNEPESSLELLREPAEPDYRDPLVGILDYIAKKCPDQEVAIAHENDLKKIEGVDVLTADAVEDFLGLHEIPVQTGKGVALLAGEDEERTLTLTDIPSELIVSIILFLSPRDIISCQRTCHTLCNVSRDPALRHLVQMERFGVSGDLSPSISYPECLLLLQRREEAWANLDFQKSVQVTVPFESTGIYDFTGGAFLLDTGLHSASRRPTIGYSYVTLPSLQSAEDQELTWPELTIGVQILDVGMAVYEHDLIAALTAKPDKHGPIDGHQSLEIRLFSFSTGRPHPLAEQPIIFIKSISLTLGHCDVLIEIVGDFLALLITFPLVRDANANMFFLMHWKKGEGHCLRPSEWGAYTSFSFLTEDTLVIPNLLQSTLEIVRIVVDGGDYDVPRLVTLCTLGLPPLAEHASIVSLSCRAEPNPTGFGPPLIPPPSTRPFRNEANDAIVFFNLLIEEADAPLGQFPETRPFTFVVHRRALIAQIPPAQRACAPFSSVPEAAAPTLVPWHAWGVPLTRWFESDHASIRWITTTAGQRAVAIEDRKPSPIIVRDFNPHAVRAALAREDAQARCDRRGMQRLPNGNRQVLKVVADVIPAGTTFREDVWSALPYIETATQKEFRYDGVMIDEERILGLETSKDDAITSFDVHILG